MKSVVNYYLIYIYIYMSIKNLNLSLYNSKYLKYKNKYLSLKKMLDGGGGGVSVHKKETEKVYPIMCLPNGGCERNVSIIKEEDLVFAMARELGVRPSRIHVFFMDNEVGRGLSADDCGILDNSRLTVTFENIIETFFYI